MEDVDQKILAVIAEVSGYDEEDLKDDDSLVGDLGLDSLDFVKLAQAAEEALEIDIDVDQFAGVNTVGQMKAKLKSLVGE